MLKNQHKSAGAEKGLLYGASRLSRRLRKSGTSEAQKAHLAMELSE